MSHAYLHWPSERGSWHVLIRVDGAGWHLRCGKTITTEKAAASDHIPPGDKSCESCLAGTLRDEDDPQAVDNDEVGQ